MATIGDFPPVGLGYLLSWIQSKCPQWNVTLLDARHDDVRSMLLRRDWDCIGFSAMTPTYKSCLALATEYKHSGGKAQVIIGGIHCTVLLQSISPVFDVIIQGEAENKLTSLLNSGHPFPADNRPVSLDNYPDIDFDAYSPNYFKPKLSSLWGCRASQGSLITSRGCIFSCRFCASPHFWKHYSMHTPGWVIRQMQLLAEKGCDHIFILDELFISNKTRLKAVAESFESGGLRHRIKNIGCQGRVLMFDDEICDYLLSMNVSMISFGIESGSNRVLQYLKTGKASVSLNTNAIHIARRNHIQAHANLMLGSPTETIPEMLQTIAWSIRAFFLGAGSVLYSITCPLPGTELWEIAKSKGTVSDTMDFDRLSPRGRLGWPGLLLDIPRWQFRIICAIAMIALLPYRIRSYLKLFLWLLKSKLMPHANHIPPR